MTRYIMRFQDFIFVLFLILGLIIITSQNTAFAQYRGAYSGQEGAGEKGKLEDPIPQVFSSQVTSVDQAKKLDKVYDGLFAALWNYAISDFNYQRQLYELLEDERFQTTRYAAEFSGLLKSAMANLNDNYTKMQKAVEDAQQEFEYTKERVREADQKVLDDLWESKIAEYNEHANQYFRLQHRFLKTYKNMVSFILKESGGYYYDSKERVVKFYKLGSYDYFGKTLDKLHVNSYEQMKLLKTHIPAHMDPDLLK